jgi:succinate-acetate transporter protein
MEITASGAMSKPKSQGRSCGWDWVSIFVVSGGVMRLIASMAYCKKENSFGG